MSFDDGYRMTVPVESLRAARLTALSLLLGSSVFAFPVQAEGIKDSVLGFFNMNPETRSGPESTLDYRPRAPLVIPPKMDLPPPQQTSALPNDWPVDPDAAARRKALADSHRRAPGADKPDPTAKRRAEAAAKEEAEGCVPAKGDDSYCLISSPWVYLTDKFGFGSRTSAGNGILLTGEEPNRKYLTDPPTGYRVPSDPVEMPKDKNGKAVSASGEEKPGMLTSFWNKLTSD